MKNTVHHPFNALALALLSSLSGLAFAQENTSQNNATQNSDSSAATSSATASSEQPSTNTQQTAQTSSQVATLHSVQVTGSRIRSADTETAQPITVIKRADIAKQGVTSLSDLLSNLTSVGAGQNTTLNNGSDGASYINLRNLGPERTLVLVNGRRWVSDLSGAVDLNTIPTAAIERIEVLKDGSSAIYGSDAIAGVINVITRSNMNGGEFTTYYGRYGQGDGSRTSNEATFGTSSDHNSVTFGLSSVIEDPVMAGARAISAEPAYRGGVKTYSHNSASGVLIAPDGSGSLVVPKGATGSGLAQSPYYTLDQFRPFSSAYYYNYTKDNYLVTPQRRKSLYLQDTYDFTDNFHLTIDGVYNKRDSEQRLAGEPLSSELLGIPLSGQSYYNPYNAAYDSDPNTSGQSVQWRRRLAEFPRTVQQSLITSHLYTGFNGGFDVGSRHFDWDAGYAFTDSNGTQVSKGSLNTLLLQNALGPSQVVNGRLACLDSQGNVIPGCVPFNPLAPAGTMPRSAINYVTFNAHSTYGYHTDDYTANITGTLLDLPAGPLGFASGYEHRKVSGYFDPDAIVSAGYTTGNASTATSGSYTSNEYYLELLAPLLKDVTFAKSLDIDAAVRYSDYNLFGSTTNGKLGIKWKPFEDLLVRGSIASSFRAPSISDLYQGASDNYAIYSDPCSSNNQDYAKVAVGCAAHNVPTNYTASYANNTSTNTGQSNYPFTSGSNPKLHPETAKNRTFGFVYSPSYVQGLDLSLDWWKVNITKAIQVPSANYILQQCYESRLDSWCSLVTRDPLTHDITNLDITPLNYGKVIMEGYDFTGNYQLPETRFGKSVINLSTTYISRNQTQQSKSSPWELYNGIYQTDTPNWRWRSNLTYSWSYHNFAAFWSVEYYSRMTDNQLTTASGQYRHVASATYHNAQVGYTFGWKGTLNIGVHNVFNRNPPLAMSASFNSFDAQYPIPGRFTYVSYTQKF